jgi:hypothetical protein
MVEIPQTWIVQNFVKNTPVGSEFSTVDVVQQIGEFVQDPGYQLNKMRCLLKTHSGSKGGSKNRDPNKYRRMIPSFITCPLCSYAKSNSSSCIIKNPEMAAQFDTQLRKKT